VCTQTLISSSSAAAAAAAAAAANETTPLHVCVSPSHPIHPGRHINTWGTFGEGECEFDSPVALAWFVRPARSNNGSKNGGGGGGGGYGTLPGLLEGCLHNNTLSYVELEQAIQLLTDVNVRTLDELQQMPRYMLEGIALPPRACLPACLWDFL